MLSQEPSVALALQILDGSPLRPGDKLNMSVTPAKFEQKGKISGGKGSGLGWAISSTRYMPKQVWLTLHTFGLMILILKYFVCEISLQKYCFKKI